MPCSQIASKMKYGISSILSGRRTYFRHITREANCCGAFPAGTSEMRPWQQPDSDAVSLALRSLPKNENMGRHLLIFLQ
jgi:hypothetical protein